MAFRDKVRDEWNIHNPQPKHNTNPDEVGAERAYINSKLPDMRIDDRGYPVRVNTFNYGTEKARKRVFVWRDGQIVEKT